MTVAFRSATHNGAAASNGVFSLVQNKPAGVVDGDFLVAATYCGPSLQGATGPAGWTLVRTLRVARTISAPDRAYIRGCLQIWTKVASSEPSSWTWTFDDLQCDVGQGGVVAFQNSSGTTDMIATHVANGGACVRISPGGTPKFQNECILRIGAFQHVTPKPARLPATVGTLAGYSQVVADARGFNAGYIGDIPNYGMKSILTMQMRAATDDAALQPNMNFVLDKACITDACITITFPSGDTAPNSLQLFPPNNWRFNSTGTPTFAWLFRDVDSGNYQTSWALRRKVGAGAYEYWNVAGVTWQAGIVYNPSTTPWYTFPAAKWVNGTTYLWSVSVKDNFGLASSFPADITHVCDTTAAPTITFTAPETPYLASQTLLFGLKTTGVINQWRVVVFDQATTLLANFNPDTSKSIWDSGIQKGPITTLTDITGATLDATLSQGDYGQNYVVYAYVSDTVPRSSGWINRT